MLQLIVASGWMFCLNTLLCLGANEKENYIPKLVRVQQFSSVYFITTADDLVRLHYLSDLNTNKLRLALNTLFQIYIERDIFNCSWVDTQWP
jgi:hypothetical protein